MDAAKRLYLRRHKPKEIADILNIPPRTVYDWRTKGEWDNLLSHETVEEAFSRRLALLAEKDPKTELDLFEIKSLTDSLVRLRAGRNQSNTEGQESGNNKRGKSQKRSNTKKRKNDVTRLTANDFKEKLHKNYFEYQIALREARHHRMRMLLKSRQIGATWYFAQEAFEDAALEGRNKIFLSATRAQAEVFRRYIISIAQQNFDIDLTGNPMVLHTNKGPAELHFLSNNSKSAQSYTGDVYIDEFFWIQKFNELYKVASGMATHKKWRKTLLSTPSAVTHEAYDLWTGERYNQRFKKKRVEFPGFKQMQSGILCPDNSWRKIITLDDAEAGGCDLFDKANLLLEYSPDEFKNLFMCLFVDDTFGVFRFADLEECVTDIGQWTDIDHNSPRPVGNYPVWGGYDPSRVRDDASFVILLPPLTPGGKFRVIKRFKWINKSFPWQAAEIKKLCQQYNFAYMGIDVTGPGLGVFDTIKTFYHQATPIHYSIGNKTAMVLKAQEIIGANRILWDVQETTITHAFLTIRKIMTGTGQISYAANRTNTTGHADVAWSIMHALANEPIAHNQAAKSTVEVL
ncbi:MAG: terminase [Desulfobacteraceae bacterium]|nr:terminase [Desulfobacteraceae bacterium]